MIHASRTCVQGELHFSALGLLLQASSSLAEAVPRFQRRSKAVRIFAASRLQPLWTKGGLTSRHEISKPLPLACTEPPARIKPGQDGLVQECEDAPWLPPLLLLKLDLGVAGSCILIILSRSSQVGTGFACFWICRRSRGRDLEIRSLMQRQGPFLHLPQAYSLREGF